jgi:tRNA1(Val) A37 N6-methylase TrmN6
VLELGCGTGAAFLCLAARVPGIEVLAGGARAGAGRPGAGERGAERPRRPCHGAGGRRRRPGASPRPPALRAWLRQPALLEDGTAPPEALRRAATHAAPAALADWTACLAAAIGHRGSATLVLPAARFADGIGALAGAGFGSPALLPLWPRAGVAAKRVLLAARRGGRAPGRVLPGLVLHAETGATPAAESVLRDAAALPV